MVAVVRVRCRHHMVCFEIVAFAFLEIRGLILVVMYRLARPHVRRLYQYFVHSREEENSFIFTRGWEGG